MASFLKDISKVGISKILIIIFGLISSVVIARVLGPEKNGIIASILVYPSLFLGFGSLGVSNATTYFLGHGLISEREIKRAIVYLWLFTSIFCLISCFLLLYYFNSNQKSLLLIGLAISPIPFTLFNTYNSGIFLGKNQISNFNKINWIPYGITSTLILLFLPFFKMDIIGVFYALLGGPIFIFIILLIKNNFITHLKLGPNWRVMLNMLRLGAIYALALVIIKLNYQIDIILLDLLSTPYEVGIYSKGAVITEYLWQIPMLFSTVVFARSANAKSEKKFSLKVVQLLRLSIIVVGFAGVGLIILSKYIILILYGESFLPSINVLMILIPGVVLLTFYKILITDLDGRGKPWVSIRAMFPALLINVILNFVFVPELGSKGAAVASTISYSIAGILFIINYSKEVDIPLKVIFKYSREDFTPLKSLFAKIFGK